MWSEGDPAINAKSFREATKAHRESIEPKMFLHLISAIASASVHNLLSKKNSVSIASKIKKIQLTAHEILRLSIKKPPKHTLLDDLQSEVENINLHGTGTSETPASPSDEPCDGDSCRILGIPLPLLADILGRCDAKSAVLASFACKYVRRAHRFDALLELSGPFRVYIMAVERLQGWSDYFGGSDGSIEASFALEFPLDGSVCCGADLKVALRNQPSLTDHGFLRSLMSPSMAFLMARIGVPETKMQDEVKKLQDKIDAQRMWVPVFLPIFASLALYTVPVGATNDLTWQLENSPCYIF
jgi:hypothetical protein